MKIAIESTHRIVQVTLDGQTVPARVWEGETESGIPILCFVTRIMVSKEEDCTEFERELQEHRQPAEIVGLLPPRLTL